MRTSYPPAPTVRALVAATVAAALLLAGCTPPSSDGGEVVTVTDPRVAEIREAREALAEPVPELVAEARRLVDALEEVWTTETSAEERATLAGALRRDPFQQAASALAAVELSGEGPDVTTARAVIDTMGEDADELLEVVADELAVFDQLPPFDEQLEQLVARWDQPDSYSAQLAAFAQLAEDAEALATDAASRSVAPGCTRVWDRRAEAATTVAERSEELRTLVQSRRGQEFDELRDAFRQDPYGLGGLLGVLDARAASECWADASAAPPVVTSLQEHVDELEAALDPPELRGG